jgi:hypothetical protein
MASGWIFPSVRIATGSATKMPVNFDFPASVPQTQQEHICTWAYRVRRTGVLFASCFMFLQGSHGSASTPALVNGGAPMEVPSLPVTSARCCEAPGPLAVEFFCFQRNRPHWHWFSQC